MKRLLPPALRRALRAGLKCCGYDLVNRRELGRDWLQDVATLHGDQSPRVIFDVGANIGQCLQRMLQHFPNAHYHSFEPFPEAFAALQQFAKSFPNIKTHCLALGEQDTNKTLFLNQASVTNSMLATAPEATLYSPPDWQKTLGVTEVPVRRLDTFCREQNIARIDLLKVDSQGYELRILQGAGDLLETHRIHCLLLEVLFVPLYQGQAYFHEIYEYLWQRHYHLVNLYEINRAPDGSAKWADALFVSHRPPPAA